MLITKTIPGYPDSNSYTINLKRSFNNVVRIELVSTEWISTEFWASSKQVLSEYWASTNLVLSEYLVNTELVVS